MLEAHAVRIDTNSKHQLHKFVELVRHPMQRVTREFKQVRKDAQTAVPPILIVSNSFVRTEITALRLAEVVFLFVPGELFVEIGLAIIEQSPHHSTFIVGYAEDAIGYIPTDQAFEEGGYELGPGLWAKVGRGSEIILLQEALILLGEV